ncbi:MAG TPA: hypothetical protein PK264_11400, partial [Hyphomicrobiaceae bacterium]|nr:hypothetical protein [Hyphomicrobiaceae bacterium]
MALSNFKEGMIVEIDPRTMPKAAGPQYVRELQALGARVSIYLVGGHCDLGRDCASLGPDAVLETTGSYNWDKSERRVINILSAASRRRLEAGIENGWRIGANYIRIDNLHWPAGSGHPRDATVMKTIVDWAHDIEDRLRRDGVIPADRPTGVVAHNNLIVWKELIERKRIRRLPAFLTSERSAQLYPARTDAKGRRLYEGDLKLQRGTLSPTELTEIKAGGEIALAYG